MRFLSTLIADEKHKTDKMAWLTRFKRAITCTAVPVELLTDDDEPICPTWSDAERNADDMIVAKAACDRFEVQIRGTKCAYIMRLEKLAAEAEAKPTRFAVARQNLESFANKGGFQMELLF